MNDPILSPPHPDDRPRMSLVVVWQGCPRELERRLDTWAASVRQGLDVVVVRTCSSMERLRLERAHPGVRVLTAPVDCDMRALRELGVSAARGDIVEVREERLDDESSLLDRLPRAEVMPVDGSGRESPPHAVAGFESRTFG